MQSTHPLLLGVRFVLEICALVAFGRFGYVFAGVLGAVALPILGATAWGVFNVPNDPSRSGRAPVAVRGVFRLLLELLFFSSATVALSQTDWSSLTWWLGGATALLYVVGFDRIKWLLAH